MIAVYRCRNGTLMSSRSQDMGFRKVVPFPKLELARRLYALVKNGSCSPYMFLFLLVSATQEPKGFTAVRGKQSRYVMSSENSLGQTLFGHPVRRRRPKWQWAKCFLSMLLHDVSLTWLTLTALAWSLQVSPSVSARCHAAKARTSM